MPYPYHILADATILAPAQDVETWIRHTLGRHLFLVQRENLDETGKRFRLHFCFSQPLPDEFDNDKQREKYGIRPIYPTWGGAELIDWSDKTTKIVRMWTTNNESWRSAYADPEKLAEEYFQLLEELNNEILDNFKMLVSEDRTTNQANETKLEKKVSPRLPKQVKRLNDWKAAWRKVKGKWRGGGSTYQELSQSANVSPATIAKILKAGDAGLLD